MNAVRSVKLVVEDMVGEYIAAVERVGAELRRAAE
jgi:hypothetical protein